PGREHFRGERCARTPEAEEAEAPKQAEGPEQQVAVGIDPEGDEYSALDQHDDEGKPPADLVGDPSGDAKAEETDDAPAQIEHAVLEGRPVLLAAEVERHPAANRAVDAGRAAGDEDGDCQRSPVVAGEYL